MPKKKAISEPAHSDHVFANELKGETPPTFTDMEKLYWLALAFFEMKPWELLDESLLVVTPNADTGELRYCSVMGAVGQVFAMHVYLGDDGLRQFRKLENGEITNPLELFAAARYLSVEAVPKGELETQDRALLKALGHRNGKGEGSPIFRSVRPGYFPWFVNAEEANTLAECMEAVITICKAILAEKLPDLWDEEGAYPCLTRAEGQESGYVVQRVRPAPPLLSPQPIQLGEEFLVPLRNQDLALRGIMELDYLFTGTPTGKKNERKACACLALAVDAATGFLYAPEIILANVPPGEALARVFLKAVTSTRTMPEEVKVRKEFETTLTPVMESFGVKLTVASRLPALNAAKTALREFLELGP